MNLRVAVLLLAVAGTTQARDFLDTLQGRGWSPDSQWLAFNPPSQKDLFLVNPRTGETLQVRPLGDVKPETGGVFAPKRPSKPVTGAPIVASPGTSRLEALVWSPDSKQLAYRIDRKTRGVLSVLEGGVVAVVPVDQALPWETPGDLRVTFEFAPASPERAARSWLRVVSPGGPPVKEVLFEHPREIAQLNLLRIHGASFLSPRKDFILYPRFQENSWRLFRESIAGDAPVALSAPAAEPPSEWKLAPDGRQLALVQSRHVTIGDIENWPNAQRWPLPAGAGTVAWSPDSRYLAAQGRENLHVLRPGEKDFRLVSDFCSPTFWGWRGAKLIFNDVRAGSTSLYQFDAETCVLEPVITPREWRSAPRERTVSPDGALFVCLMMEQDREGRLRPEVWSIELRPRAAWKKLYTFKPSL